MYDSRIYLVPVGADFLRLMYSVTLLDLNPGGSFVNIIVMTQLVHSDCDRQYRTCRAVLYRKWKRDECAYAHKMTSVH